MDNILFFEKELTRLNKELREFKCDDKEIAKLKNE